MATDSDIKKDFDEAYNQANAGWCDYLKEAEQDFKFMCNDQWNSVEKQYLAAQRRNALVFNRIRRVVKIISGYQRKNRLAYKIDAVGMEDDRAASQITGVLMDVMRVGNGYNVMSDAFECGPCITGLNVVEPFVDRNGDIKFKRIPYNKCLLDPTFSERDLSDCGYVIRREYVSRDEAKMLVPGHDAEIDDLQVGRDEKFPYLTVANKRFAERLLSYDEFWRKTTKKIKVLLDRTTGQEQVWHGGQKALDYVLTKYPMVTAIDRWVDSVNLEIFIQGVQFYSGPDPFGLDEYRFVPLLGFWYPEVESDKLKLQGVVRSIRDPQVEFNKRLSQEIDIIESQINSGYDAIEGAVVNPESLYQSGQGKVTWVKRDGNPVGLDAIRKKQPVDIPQGLFMLNQTIDNLLTEIPGINEELFGTEEKDIAGVLSKMRQGGALTILQDLFDHYRFSKRLLGKKVINLIQKHYHPQKVMRIINEQPIREFYDPDLSRYDLSVQEGLLTDSQRQMYYEELKALQQAGAPIPFTAIVEAAPIQLKEHLKKHIAMAEQAQMQASQGEQQMTQITQQLMQSQIAENLAQAQERRAEIQQNIATAGLNRAKTAAEIQKMQLDGFAKTAKAVADLEKIRLQDRKKARTRR
jgi:hypothetical protein